MPITHEKALRLGYDSRKQYRCLNQTTGLDSRKDTVKNPMKFRALVERQTHKVFQMYYKIGHPVLWIEMKLSEIVDNGVTKESRGS